MFLSALFVSGCSKSGSTSTNSQKYEAEVGFNVTVETDYSLFHVLNASVFSWDGIDPDEGEKPELRIVFNIIEPTGNSDEENETFSNRYENGQYIQELNANIVSAKFEDAEQLYNVKEGDELKIITTIKKSEKYNFDYFTQSESNKDIEVKEDGDNILIISKITVGEDDDSDSYEDDSESDSSEEKLKYTTLSEYKELKLKSLNEHKDAVSDFTAEELSLTKEYPFEVMPLFFASYTSTWNHRGEVTRQSALTERADGQGYSFIETGADLSDYDGPLTAEEIAQVKSEGLEKYQEFLDYRLTYVISEFDIITD